jgi:hypothetical protein
MLLFEEIWHRCVQTDERELKFPHIANGSATPLAYHFHQCGSAILRDGARAADRSVRRRLADWGCSGSDLVRHHNRSSEPPVRLRSFATI